MNNILLIFSAFSFLFFGIGCLRTPYLRTEFERYGLAQFRVLTGYLQLLGAAGILIGFYFISLQLVSCAGLSVLMFLGLGVRIKIKDNFWQSLPALMYCTLNAYLFWALLKL